MRRIVCNTKGNNISINYNPKIYKIAFPYPRTGYSLTIVKNVLKRLAKDNKIFWFAADFYQNHNIKEYAAIMENSYQWQIKYKNKIRYQYNIQNDNTKTKYIVVDNLLFVKDALVLKNFGFLIFDINIVPPKHLNPLIDCSFSTSSLDDWREENINKTLVKIEDDIYHYLTSPELWQYKKIPDNFIINHFWSNPKYGINSVLL